jgi:quinol monooxygenase YgiN
MSDEVHWVLEVNIKDGELDNFKAVMKDMVEATQNEPGASNYEWFISEDGNSCHIYERYADSAATMTHLGSFGQNFAERFLAAVEPTRFVVYGNPNDEVRGALAGFGAVHMSQIGGFAR